ncbi:hypothetical protein QVD17_33480, partial [Tagetes erecta]
CVSILCFQVHKSQEIVLLMQITCCILCLGICTFTFIRFFSIRPYVSLSSSSSSYYLNQWIGPIYTG